MDETKTKEQLEMELWRDGNRQAFLWNLLKNHKIESPNSHQDEITLQDYWRYNVNTKSSRNDQQLIIAGEVEKDLNGNLWHIVHMPPILSNGEKTWKADLKNPKWKLIENLITQRISDTQSKGSDFSITGGDRRAQLQGTILRSAFFRRPGAKVEFHIRADHSVILGPANFSRAIFSSITDFKNAFFIKSANFHHATFKGEIRLNDAQFLDEVNFSKVKLFNHADFQRTKFFKTTYFDEANFLSSANFNNAFFLDFVSFNSAKFNAYATFLNAKFKNSSQFNKVIFSGNFTTFKDTNFYGSTVFSEASFILVADFRDTIFYNSAVFEDAKFNKEAHFNKAVFIDEARFNNSFFNVADFTWANFKGFAVFEETILFNAKFINTEWQIGGSFKDSKVTGIPEFEGAKLHEDFSFDGVEFTCLDKTIFWTRGIFWFLILASLVFRIAGWGIDIRLSTLSLVFALAAICWFCFSGWKQSDGKLERQTRAFRTLSRLCDEVRNKRDAAKFHHLELRAQRLRFGKGWRERLLKQPLERAFSCAYDFFAGYGESIGRPLIFLGIVVVFFATFFWIWEGGGLAGPKTDFWTREGHHIVGRWGSADPVYFEALGFSLSRVFPLGPWAETGETCNFHDRLLVQDKNGKSCRPGYLMIANQRDIEFHRLAVKLLAMMETILGIALIFLFGLAIRRRFRIST